MKLLVGLGNPGAQYAGNRHNIGFMAVDAIAAAHGIGPWKSRHAGHLAEGSIGGDKVLLLKPQTYMNKSGDSVQQVTRFYKLTPADVIVFYDELDLAPGKVRVKVGGGNGGHNGLRSIDPQIGLDYKRVRLGIGHPARSSSRPTCWATSPRPTRPGSIRCSTKSAVTSRSSSRATIPAS